MRPSLMGRFVMGPTEGKILPKEEQATLPVFGGSCRGSDAGVVVATLRPGGEF